MTLTLETARSLLGVNDRFTSSQVNSAFRAIARQCHPDKSTATSATSEFQLLSEARDLLLSNSRREEECDIDHQVPSARSAQTQCHPCFSTKMPPSCTKPSSFAQRGLVWGFRHCLRCRRVCMQLQRDTAMCECGHRLRQHDPLDLAGAFRCGQCRCEQFRFKEDSRCQCGCPASSHSCKLGDSRVEFEADSPQRGGYAESFEPPKPQPTGRSPRKEHKDLPPLNKREGDHSRVKSRKEPQAKSNPAPRRGPHTNNEDRRPSHKASQSTSTHPHEGCDRPQRKHPDASLPPDGYAARFQRLLGAYAEGLGGSG